MLEKYLPVISQSDLLAGEHSLSVAFLSSRSCTKLFVTVSEAEEGSLQVPGLIWWCLLSNAVWEDLLDSFLRRRGQACLHFGTCTRCCCARIEGCMEAWAVAGGVRRNTVLSQHFAFAFKGASECSAFRSAAPVPSHTARPAATAVPPAAVLCLSCLVCLRLLDSFTYIKQPVCDPGTKGCILSAPSGSKLR